MSDEANRLWETWLDLLNEAEAACEKGQNYEKLAISTLVAEEVEKEREACAKACEDAWRNAPNVAPHYIQNAIADGCLESAHAIRSRSHSERRTEEMK